jgi:hypothetical protein
VLIGGAFSCALGFEVCEESHRCKSSDRE